MPNFDFAPMPVDAGMEVVGIFLIFLLGVYLLMFVFAILAYVLQSLGMYTIAKRRGIHNPWLAWLPIGNMWIMGSISDQYQYVVKGRVRNRRKWLIGLSFVTILSSIPVPVINFILLAQGNSGNPGSELMLFWLLLMLLFGVMSIVTIVALVMEYIALYDLFCSCDPGNAVLFLILSIVFPVSLPFFLFFARKKDGGMPPRKPAQPEVIPVLEGQIEE